MHKPFAVLIALLIVSIASFILAFSFGSVSLSVDQVITALIQHDASMSSTIIWELRLPRAYIAFVTGGLLALAGLLMQVLLKNPLADPYILGVSSGASVAALSAMALGLSTFWMSASALSGALFTILLVFGLSHQAGSWNPSRLLLTGVVIASGWGAMINFILSISPDKPLRGMLFWLMGDISHINPSSTSLAILIAGALISLVIARQLNILSRGELQASALGVAVKQIRMILFFLASGLTAFAVIQAGSIGFVGLVIPHMLRLMIGSDHRLLIPGSILLGGSLVLISDTLARTIIAPQQLPVGVITAFIGVPFFLYLLNKSYNRNKD